MMLIWFIVAISVLVVIHEYGHFWVARRCGVRVIRFSVGFGKPFWSFRDRLGTEYALAPLPLGGYVKMLDEREAPVPAELYSESFNAKTPWQRIAIAAAGPIANFLFAIVAYWALFIAGTTGVVATVGHVEPNTPAAIAGIESGDHFIEINGLPATTWEDVSWRLLGYLGESATFPVTLEDSHGHRREVTVAVSDWMASSEQPDPLEGLGIEPRRLVVPAVIAEVLDDSAAGVAGLATGDRIISVDGQAISDWSEWVEAVRAAPGKPLQITFMRNGQELSLVMTPAERILDSGVRTGFAGVTVNVPSLPGDWLVSSSLDPVSALWRSIGKTADLTVFTLDSLWKMVMGDVSVKNLSGPITIAKVAGASASGGVESFVQFLALLSVSLAVLNLLPVPMLDGGHIVFSLVESVTGKALPEQVQIAAMKAGMLVLLSLMAIAFYNDISRL